MNVVTTNFLLFSPDPHASSVFNEMDGLSRKRAATTISRAWRGRRRSSWKLSRARRWAPTTNPFKGEYKFTRVVSTNSSGSQLSIATDALGVVKLFVGANNADNFQLDFSLQQIILRLGGSAQISATVPNYTEFTGLFDQWCIDKVELMLVPTYSGHSINGNVFSQLPTLVHAIDDDDSAAASKTDLQQYGNCGYTQLLNGTYDVKPLRVFRPKPAMAVFQQGATFAYGEIARGPKWIDVAYPTVPHYSFKAALDNANVSGTANTVICYVDVVAKMHFRFKTVR